MLQGLKLGIYSDYGTRTCMSRPGSFGHEEQDAAQFARWGVDSLKMDGCNKPPNASYDAGFPRMARALNATGRPILFSCSWPGAGLSRNPGPGSEASLPSKRSARML